MQINAKDGGVDAQDWSEMLLRMYERWAERRGFEFGVDAVSEGTEAGHPLGRVHARAAATPTG